MPTILIRKISPYLGADVLLGVFTSPQQAEKHRSAYLTMRTETPSSDPWRKQPYKPEGLQPADLIVQEIQGSHISTGTAVFVISNYSEGFGQTIRRFVSVHNDQAVAQRQAARLEEADTDTFPNYFRVQEAIAGQLLSDAQDEQPCWYD